MRLHLSATIPKKALIILLIALAIIALVGCASTKVTMHVVGKKPPLCRTQSSSQTALVFSGTAWRENQKEVALREEMASRAISRFFKTSSCFAKAEVQRLVSENEEAIALSDTDILEYARSSGEHYDKVIIVRVEELGPFLVFYLSPILWEGGTEVVLRVRVLDVKTSTLEANISTHWKDSGAFVIKGTKTLEQDLQAALDSVF